MTPATILCLALVISGESHAQKPGQQLIGKLEGPEIVVDPSRLPRTFNEAPQLAELVRAGKLPPVRERIGEEPLVVKPVHEIGKYGGTWRRGFTGPGDKWNGYRCCSGTDQILARDYTGTQLVPNIAKRWEVTDDGRVTTVHLRRGMKWSDGHPFTADDFIFWYEDMYQNKELVPTPSSVMTINGKPVVLEKVDTYTVRFRSPDPYYMLPEMLAGPTPLGGQARRGLEAMGGYAPAHYLKQFHPKYVPRERLDALMKAEKFDSWVSLFKFKNDWALNPDLPVVSPWRTTRPINTPTWVLERNPYSIWVDTAGNQLPYIDRVVMTLAENLEIVNLRAIAGSYDFQARHLDLSKLPVFLENQSKFGYRVHLDPANFGGDMIIKFNMSYEADPEVAKWINNVDFRRALSLGIDREQINETFWLGTGKPSSVVPADDHPYNPGPEYRTLWSIYDPKKANEMLDNIGLSQRDPEGYRLRTDGKGRLAIDITTLGGQFVPYTRIGEMITAQWKRIGIELRVKEVERSLAVNQSAANTMQLCAWANDGSDDLFIVPDHVFPYAVAQTCGGGALYARWFQSDGKQGKMPPPRLREVMEKWKRGLGTPPAERVRLGKEIWKIMAEDVYAIGVVGLGPAQMGLRVAKAGMGNVPARQANNTAGMMPSISRPVTFYWKTP